MAAGADSVSNPFDSDVQPLLSSAAADEQYPPICFNHGPRRLRDLPALLLFLLAALSTIALGIVAAVRRNPHAHHSAILHPHPHRPQRLLVHCLHPHPFVHPRLPPRLPHPRPNGKIVPRERKGGGYLCVWRQASWVLAYFALTIVTMVWSLATVLEAKVYVISVTIAQWYFSVEGSKPSRSLRSSLRIVFGPSFGTVCFSGMVMGAVRFIRMVVDGATRKDAAPGFVNLILQCCASLWLSTARVGVRNIESARSSLPQSPELEIVVADVTEGADKLAGVIGDAEAVICATGFRPSLDLFTPWKLLMNEFDLAFDLGHFEDPAVTWVLHRLM